MVVQSCSLLHLVVMLSTLLGCTAKLLGYEPGDRSLLSAHNCYPYHGMWADRIDIALGTGYPISIEQDLCWVEADSEFHSVVAHNGPFDGTEPSLEKYFFERVRDDVESALQRAQSDPSERQHWPMIVLDLDVKDDTLEHAQEIHKVLIKYESWLTFATRVESIEDRQALHVGPVMVLISGSDHQQYVFHDQIEVGQRVIAFGRAKIQRSEEIAYHQLAPELMVSKPADNFRRWWNNSWHAVEEGGARRAGLWEAHERQRLESLVEHAHRLGYFIRFYTINGHSKAQGALLGSGSGYNTGSLDAARERWIAQIEAGVDLIATDQYAEFDLVGDQHNP